MSLAEPERRGLTDRRVALGLSQKQLAKAMGTQQCHISDLETGKQDPHVDTLQRWARALGLGVRISFAELRPETPQGAA